MATGKEKLYVSEGAGRASVSVDEIKEYVGQATSDEAAMLQAGTDTTPRLFSAKAIHDEIARQIAAAA